MATATGLRRSRSTRAADRRSTFIELLHRVKLLAVMLSPNAEIVYCNEHFLRVTGWRLGELTGKVWQQVLAPPGIGDLSGLFEQLLRDAPGSWHEENEIVTRTGEHLFIRWNNLLLRDETGLVVAAACVGENVTERILLQRKLAAEAASQVLSVQRELHDGLGQELFGISMTARSLATLIERGRTPSTSQLLELSAAANNAMDTCRRISRNMAVVSKSNGDLVGALKQLMDVPALWQGPKMCFESTVLNNVQLSSEASEHVYKIAQEAVTNALKHGHAQKIILRINVRAKRVVVSIADDGIGLDGRPGKGLGMRIMQHRAGLLHAVLQIQNQPEGGLVVRLRCTVASNSP